MAVISHMSHMALHNSAHRRRSGSLVRGDYKSDLFHNWVYGAEHVGDLIKDLEESEKFDFRFEGCEDLDDFLDRDNTHYDTYMNKAVYITSLKNGESAKLYLKRKTHEYDSWYDVYADVGDKTGMEMNYDYEARKVKDAIFEMSKHEPVKGNNVDKSKLVDSEFGDVMTKSEDLANQLGDE